MLGAVYPWTPMLALLCRRGLYSDHRRRFLLAWILWGFLFFSLSANKLPGYLLPLVPPACALCGLALAETRWARTALASAAALVAFVPVIGVVLPEALAAGLSRARLESVPWVMMMPLACFAPVCWWLEASGRRAWAVGTVAVLATWGVLYLKFNTAAKIEASVSARPLWSAIRHDPDAYCAGDLHRALRYALNYYTVEPLPDCESAPGKKMVGR
jgi:4-amino-4-deoxy-L-arabinose transferase-like glycosyltransferase